METANFWVWLSVVAIVGGIGIGSMLWAYRGNSGVVVFPEPIAPAAPLEDSDAAQEAMDAFKRADAAFRAKRYRWAGDKYSQALQSAPSFAAAYHNRGLVAANLGQYGDAAQDLAKAAELYLEQGHQSALTLIRQQLEMLKKRR